MSGRTDPTKQANSDKAARDEWLRRVLAYDPRDGDGTTGRRLPRRAEELVARRNERLLAANRQIAEAVEAPSSRNPKMPLWGEATTGTITDERKASVNMILDVQFDEGFKKREQEKRDKTAAALVDDEVVQKAHENWPEWYENQDKHGDDIKAFVESVLARQGDIIGLASKPTKVAYPRFGESVTTSGQFDVKTGKLQIFGIDPDFQEFLNTLTHENTHAFQAKLVEDLDSGAIGPRHPDYQAALALKMNRDRGYISPDLSAQYNTENPKQAYEQQCSEAHAFAAGDEVSSAVVGKLNARLSDEKRQKNEDRTFASKMQLAERLQTAEQQEVQDELKLHADDMEEQLAKRERANQEEAKAAEAERAKLAAEAEKRKWEAEQDEEDFKMEQEMARTSAELAEFTAQIAAREAAELMDKHGMSEDQVTMFRYMRDKIPTLTPEAFMREDAALREKTALMETYSMSDEQAQMFMMMKEQRPSLTPEVFLLLLKST